MEDAVVTAALLNDVVLNGRLVSHVTDMGVWDPNDFLCGQLNLFFLLILCFLHKEQWV